MYREARSCCHPSSLSADAGAGGAEAGPAAESSDDGDEEPLERTTEATCAAEALATVECCWFCCCTAKEEGGEPATLPPEGDDGRSREARGSRAAALDEAAALCWGLIRRACATALPPFMAQAAGVLACVTVADAEASMGAFQGR